MDGHSMWNCYRLAPASLTNRCSRRGKLRRAAERRRWARMISLCLTGAFTCETGLVHGRVVQTEAWRKDDQRVSI